MEDRSVEKFLFDQLEKVAPGKYTIASVLQLFKSKLRFPCTHLKGGGRVSPLRALGKDYNLSIFTFSSGVTEIKCLYNCGLKISTADRDLVSAYNDLYDIARSQSTNFPASSERRPLQDPGPAPTYTDAYRQRIRENSDRMIETLKANLEQGVIKPGSEILGGIFPHPDPIEAPESQLERSLFQAYKKLRSAPPALTALVVVQDQVPLLKPKKIRKAQSRRRRK